MPLRVLEKTMREPSGESAGSKSLAGLCETSRGPLPSEPAIITSAFPVCQETKTSGTTVCGCLPGASGVVKTASRATSLPQEVEATSR